MSLERYVNYERFQERMCIKCLAKYFASFRDSSPPFPDAFLLRDGRRGAPRARQPDEGPPAPSSGERASAARGCGARRRQVKQREPRTKGNKRRAPPTASAHGSLRNGTRNSFCYICFVLLGPLDASPAQRTLIEQMEMCVIYSATPVTRMICREGEGKGGRGEWEGGER